MIARNTSGRDNFVLPGRTIFRGRWPTRFYSPSFRENPPRTNFIRITEVNPAFLPITGMFASRDYIVSENDGSHASLFSFPLVLDPGGCRGNKERKRDRGNGLGLIICG